MSENAGPQGPDCVSHSALMAPRLTHVALRPQSLDVSAVFSRLGEPLPRPARSQPRPRGGSREDIINIGKHPRVSRPSRRRSETRSRGLRIPSSKYSADLVVRVLTADQAREAEAAFAELGVLPN